MLSEIKDASGSSNKNLILTMAEKRSLENHANLVSIIKTVEHLERLFTNGVLTNADYESNVSQLITQFKVLQNALKNEYPDLGSFWTQYHLDDCSLAKNSILAYVFPKKAFQSFKFFSSTFVNSFPTATGMAATLLHNSGGGTDKESDMVHVLDAGQKLLTLNDSLSLNFRAVDELLPTFKELMTSLTQINKLPPDLEGREKLSSWLQTLNARNADDSLTDSEARQFTMDLETVYASFRAWVRDRK